MPSYRIRGIDGRHLDAEARRAVGRTAAAGTVAHGGRRQLSFTGNAVIGTTGEPQFRASRRTFAVEIGIFATFYCSLAQIISSVN